MDLKIKRAIPQRRYQLGDFGLVLLGEIEVHTQTHYKYIMAAVPEGGNQPVLYICCEITDDTVDGKYLIRVLADKNEKILGPMDDIGDIEQFADNAIAMIKKIYRMPNEIEVRLM